MSTTNRIVVVTGSARGIGRGCTEVFIDEGWTVIGLDKDPPDEPQKSERYRHEICDVADPNQIEGAIAGTASTFGRIDALVNNAGTHPATRLIDEVTIEEFETLIRINLVSVFAASKAALPHLRKTKGSIVNIASLVGLVGQEGAVEYCASKAAITGISKALAIDEAKHGVRVNSVCPGAILTPLAQSLNTPSMLDSIGKWSWMERLGVPREVGQLVVFLASDRASFVTGQDVVIAGGAELGYGLKGSLYYSSMIS